MNIFNYFGGRFTSFNLILFILCLLIPAKFVKTKLLKLIYSTTCTMLILSQAISLIITENFIGYEFIVHTNYYDIITMLKLYQNIIIIVSIMSVLLMVMFYFIENISRYISLWLDKVKKKYDINFGKINIRYEFTTFYLVSIIFFSLDGKFDNKGILSKTIETISFFTTNSNSSFQKSLDEIGINNYVGLDNINAVGNNKDIIIISLESFEAAYLTEKFSHLTPFLNRLKNEWYYYDMEQNIGSNWTSGSLYTMFTGIPSFFGRKHNSIFHTAYKKEIVGLPDILKKLNYDLTFITKDAKFSGTRALLGCFGFDRVIDDRELNDGYDQDIFVRLKSEIIRSKSRDKHFAIFASTLDTHGPNGIMDKRFLELMNGLDDLEYSAAILDYLIKDFFQFMKKNNFLDSTTIIFLPDHLYMVKPSIFHSIKLLMIV